MGRGQPRLPGRPPTRALSSPRSVVPECDQICSKHLHRSRQKHAGSVYSIDATPVGTPSSQAVNFQALTGMGEVSVMLWSEFRVDSGCPLLDCFEIEI
jgi:hypothetical protein